jgi:hypothetical protein
LNAVLGTQYPLIDIVEDGGSGKIIEKNFRKDTADHILVQGTLDSGAVASITVSSLKSIL